jgi:hypothetical protein
MKRSTIQRTLKYGMGIFISMLALFASLLNSHYALAAQGTHKAFGNCHLHSAAIITPKYSNLVLSAPNVMFFKGAPVRLQPANGQDNQKWNFVPVLSNGITCIYRIVSFKTDAALTIPKAPHISKVPPHGGKVPAHTADASSQEVILSANTYGNDQLWSVEPIFGANFQMGFAPGRNSGNAYKIVSYKSKMVLDGSGSLGGEFGGGALAVIQAAFSGGPSQIWSITPSTPQPGVRPIR